MFLLNHVEPKKAKGKVAEVYSLFPPPFTVPDPVLMASVSPEIANIQGQIIRYYGTHPKLDYGLMAMIRYVIANDLKYEFCIKLNSEILKTAGNMSDKDLKALNAEPENVPLEDFQKAMLLFVLKAIRTPEDVTAEDIEELHEYGWEDKHIYDAVNNAASMLTASVLYKAFRR